MNEHLVFGLIALGVWALTSIGLFVVVKRYDESRDGDIMILFPLIWMVLSIFYLLVTGSIAAP